MARDEDVDRLYQLPLAEFTAARNALAKARGKDGAAIRALQKPALAAWAVNQLHWHRPKVFAGLVKAAEDLRAAHAKALSGTRVDLSAVEAAHRQALRAATDEIRGLLAEAGEAATPATMNAVAETLHALPGREPPGRLAKPLRPQGFEALAGLVPKLPAGMRGSSRPAPAPAPATSPARPAATKQDVRREARQAAAEAKRTEQARRREKAAVEQALRAARRESQQATKALETARHALAQAERRHDQLRDQVQFALKQIQDSRDEIGRADQHRREAEAERERLETRLAALRGG